MKPPSIPDLPPAPPPSQFYDKPKNQDVSYISKIPVLQEVRNTAAVPSLVHCHSSIIIIFTQFIDFLEICEGI